MHGRIAWLYIRTSDPRMNRATKSRTRRFGNDTKKLILLRQLSVRLISARTVSFENAAENDNTPFIVLYRSTLYFYLFTYLYL